MQQALLFSIVFSYELGEILSENVAERQNPPNAAVFALTFRS